MLRVVHNPLTTIVKLRLLFWLTQGLYLGEGLDEG